MKKNLLLLFSALFSCFYLKAHTDTITINEVSYTIFAPGLWVEVPFNCGDDVTFMYNGISVTYGTIESSGRCWMDRNLGASRVAQSSTDEQSYGDLFQWGRGDDGHQLINRFSGDGKSTSGTANGPVAVGAEGNNFIRNTVSAPFDWLTSGDANRWGNPNAEDRGPHDPCPPGWRVPTKDEWDTERDNWSPKNANGAFNSIKLPRAGSRNALGNVVSNIGSYWSSSVNGNRSVGLNFDGGNIDLIEDGARVFGRSVRCIKD